MQMKYDKSQFPKLDSSPRRITQVSGKIPIKGFNLGITKELIIFLTFYFGN